MKQFLILAFILLVAGVAGAQVSSQRVILTTADPPTTCAPGKIYSNAVQGKMWQGKSDATCVLIITGTASSGVAANTVVKSDGAHLVASQLNDDGTFVQIATGASKKTQIGGSDPTGASFGVVDLNTTVLGDINSQGNSTTLTINDATAEITAVASFLTNQITLTAAGGINPSSAAGSSVGSTSFPFSSVIVGNAANQSSQITGGFTGNRVVTLPDASITLPSNFGAPLSILVNNTVLATATGTVYSSPGNDGTPLSITTEGNVSWPCPRAGTISQLRVRTGGTAKTNTPTTVITVRKNGVDTALTLTMTETVNTTTADTTHSFTVAAGDLITVSFSTSGAAAVSTSIAGVSFLLN